MYTIQFDTPAQRVRGCAAVLRALAESRFSARLTCPRVYRLPCGVLRGNWFERGLSFRGSSWIPARDLAAMKRDRTALRKGGKCTVAIEHIRRKERAPLRGSLPPGVAKTFDRRDVAKRKNGVALDWEDWLVFNNIVNRALDASIGARGKVWSQPHYMPGKLVIRHEGRGVVDYTPVRDSIGRLKLLPVFT